MTREEWKEIQRQNRIINLSHEMLILGYLMAIQDYALSFGLESTAAYVLRRSGICKEDLIRCQLESGHENERMLEIIEKAFSEPLFK